MFPMVAKTDDNMATFSPSCWDKSFVNSLVFTSIIVDKSPKLSERKNAATCRACRLQFVLKCPNHLLEMNNVSSALRLDNARWQGDTSLAVVAASRNLARRLWPSSNSETKRVLSLSCAIKRRCALVTNCSHKLIWTSGNGSCAACFALFNAVCNMVTSGPLSLKAGNAASSMTCGRDCNFWRGLCSVWSTGLANPPQSTTLTPRTPLTHGGPEPLNG